MASSPDPLAKVELQGAGDNPGAWHTPLNNALSQIIEGYAQVTTVNVASANVSLTDTQYVSNQARSAGFLFTGTLTANRTVTAPDREKLYFVHDQSTHSGYTLEFGVDGGDSIYLTPGFRYWVYCDGAGGLRVIAQSDPSFATASGTNSYVVTVEQAALSQYAGSELNVKFTNASTGDSYLQVNGGSFIQITKDVSTALAAGDISAGMTGKLVYNGTTWSLFPPKIATTLGLIDGGLQTTDFNVAVNTRYVVDCNGADIDVTMPSSAAVGDIVVLAKFGTGAMNMDWNGLKFNGSTSAISTVDEGVSTLVYTGADRGWVEG